MEYNEIRAIIATAYGKNDDDVGKLSQILMDLFPTINQDKLQKPFFYNTEDETSLSIIEYAHKGDLQTPIRILTQIAEGTYI